MRVYLLILITVSFALVGMSCRNDGMTNSVAVPKAARLSPNLEVRRFVVQIPYGGNLLEQNIYLLFDKTLKQGLIIDPGSGSKELETVIAKSGITIKGILNTHGHFDHTGANGLYRQKYRVDVYGHANDKPFYQIRENEPTQWISSESDLRLGDLDIQILPMSGHTEGSVCFLVADHLFSGDTLFQGSIGRTPDGPATVRLVDNIRNKLLSLPANTHVYPGHGEFTSIGTEKKANPFLQNSQTR